MHTTEQPLIKRFLFWVIFTVNCGLSLPAIASTYAVTSTTFSWIDATNHTKLGPTKGGLYSSLYAFTNTGGCGTTPPTIDDTLSDNIPLGFTFTFGTVGFTSVRIMSNGRIQFNNNTTCGFGSPVTQLPYPDAALTYSMRIYGNDLDPSLQSEISGYTTSCTSRASCYISYSTIGTAPNRKFVVTYSNVPEWTTTSSASGYYNMQLILQEDGQFIYQYGTDVPGPQASLAQIGWEISTTDYAVAAVGFPANNSAFLFTVPGSVTTTPGSFNAFDSSTTSGAITGFIKTKIAASAFNLDVVALNTSGTAVLNAFTGGVAVELVDASSGSCSTFATIGNTQSIDFTTANAGRKTVSFSESNAWLNVRLRMKYPIFSPTTISCSSDDFAIRPDHFIAAATDLNWTTAGLSRTLNASASSSSPTHKAGQPFTLKTTAYSVSNTVTSGYNGTPVASLSSCVLPVSSCVIGTLTAGSFTASSGTLTSVTANYSDVGAISATLSDASFANVDAADGSTLADRTITSSTFTIGRFVPDHFDATINTPVFAPACNTFTYIGQPINYATNPIVNLSAKNAGGATTQNYTGSLWKISAADINYAITPAYSEASHALTVLNSSAPTAIDNGNGTGGLSFADTTSNILQVTRSNPIASFNAEISLSFNLWDTDGVAVAHVNGSASSNPVQFGRASAGNGISFTGTNKTHLWGRLAMANANGSELTALTVPLFSEYFNGKSFVSNTADNCTSLNLSSQLSLGNPTTANGIAQAGNTAMTIAPLGLSQATLANATLNAGNAGLSFSAPGAGNTGYINISGSFVSLSWLLYDWNNDGFQDNSPAARVTFGVYRGNPKVIYFREIY